MSDTTPSKLHIAFASAEAEPFVKTGGLGDVAGSLPHALKAAGADVVVFVPRYDTIAQEYKDRMEHLCDFYVPLGWRNEYCGLERLNHEGVDYLFVDNERYFSRGYPYGFFDDGERFAYFSKAIVEALQYLPHTLDNFTCDVLHCNDWHTAMAPVFLREFYQALPLYQNVKTVFSIHNIAFQGQYSAKVLNDILGLAHIPAAAFQLTCGPDAVNYMQGALNYTDAITTVSPTYAEEIKTPDFGEHLDGILRRRAPILQGIVNGIDTAAFDPTTDPRIAANYSVQDRTGKAECKARLQQELGLEVRDDRPLMVMVTRLTRQKGMDLVTYALDRILSGGVQVAVLGTGDTEYENALRYFEGKYPGTMAARIQFDPALSQRMYAGADLFLMPSLFEPCGLSQMIAMRYGTLPIVRETGGLKDTVIPYNCYTGEGTGFSFAHFNGDEMADAVFRAARLFWDDHAAFNGLVENAMRADFSWKRSADAYIAVYHNLHPEIPMPQPEPEPEPVVEPEPLAEVEPVSKDAAPAEVPVADDTPAEEPKAEEKPVEKPEVKAEVASEPVAEPADAQPVPEDAAPAKKATAKKAATKKTTAKKTVKNAEAEAETEKTAAPAKKAPAKKTAAKTSAVKADDAAAEKEPAKKAPAKKAAAKKTTAKKVEPAAETTVAEEATEKPAKTAKKAPSKKTVKKAEEPVAETAVEETAEKPAPAKKPAAKKAAAKSTAKDTEAPAAKSAEKKTAAKKASAQKTLDLDAATVVPAKEEAPKADEAYVPAHAKPKDAPTVKAVPKVTRKGKRK